MIDSFALSLLHFSFFLGYSQSKSIGMEPQDKVSFMTSLLRALNLTKLIIVSPSASGAYSMPFVIQHQRYLSGFVAVEACCSNGYEWANFEVPTVIIYGGASAALTPNISSELKKIPENNLVIIPDAPHAVYTKKPIEFMTVLVNFMEYIHPR
uniref:Alpha/beta hydrolase n=1 Tax=Ascaris lumbricoides TaxID=6252 RepID=A0A0M3HJJ6_ASCLU